MARRDFAVEAGRPACPRVPDITRDELVEIVRRVLESESESETEAVPEQDYFPRLFETNVAHPAAADLEGAPAQRIVDAALAHRPLALCGTPLRVRRTVAMIGAMPTFTAPDGTELAYHVRGEGAPLVVLPGGPMRASGYLGDLGGLAGHRRLVLLDLRGTGESAVPADPATYRCDRLVGDVEALRAHLGLAHMDVLGHSAGGSLAMLYAARYPARLGRLVLVTATPWALGMPATGEDRLAAARLRAGEPWFEEAFPAFEAWVAGKGDFDPAFASFFYGRWDETAKDHDARADEQFNDEAADMYGSEGAYDPPATRTALARLDSPVLVLASELDGGPRPELARRSAEVFPNAEFAVQPGAGHYPWLDDPEWFVRRAVAFLDGDEVSLPLAE